MAAPLDDRINTPEAIVTGGRPIGTADCLVSTRITLRPQTQPSQVEWRVRQKGPEPKIIDVVAEGVSLVITNRAEFDAIVNRRGLDGLLEGGKAVTVPVMKGGS
jgi:phospholipid transport system substrate-binding protein